MIDYASFAAGLGVIALQISAGVEPEKAKAYHAAFEAVTDWTEWDAFSKVAASRHGWRAGCLPTVPELLDALREFRGGPSLDVEAIRAYERVQACGEYTAEGGTTWTYRRVLGTCGRAAAEAFLAAGGGSVWATSWKETDRRERFVAAYQLAARQEPAARLLPAGQEQAQLTDGQEHEAPASPEEAQAVLGAIRARLAEPAEERPEAMLERVRARLAAVTTPGSGSTEVVATDARLAELRRQAEEITAEGTR